MDEILLETLQTQIKAEIRLRARLEWKPAIRNWQLLKRQRALIVNRAYCQS